MMGLKEELLIFACAILSGIVIVIGYNCIRLFRRIFKHNIVVINIEDFLFWIGSGIYLFVKIYYTSDGGIRWFFVLGVVFGMGLCAILTRFIKKWHKKLYIKKS